MYDQKDLSDALNLYEDCLETMKKLEDNISTLRSHLRRMNNNKDGYQTQYGSSIWINTAELNSLHEIIGDMHNRIESNLNERKQSEYREEQAKRNRYSSEKPYGSNN